MGDLKGCSELIIASIAFVALMIVGIFVGFIVEVVALGVLGLSVESRDLQIGIAFFLGIGPTFIFARRIGIFR